MKIDGKCRSHIPVAERAGRVGPDQRASRGGWQLRYSAIPYGGALVLVFACALTFGLRWSRPAIAAVTTINNNSRIPTLDPTAGLTPPRKLARLDALAVLKSMRPPPSHTYLQHLYFQPLHVRVLRENAAFSNLASVAGSLTGTNNLRPGYRGESPLLPAHPIFLTVRVSPVAPKPELLLGFGQEVAGRIQIRGSGGRVLIGTGESRGEALHRPWGGIHVLRLKAGRTLSTPYSAFRYATITFEGSKVIKLNRLRLDFKYYPVRYRGSFACSDPLLTRMWYTGAYTAHLCMQEEIWDAPKRDRAMWMGDMQISGQVINNVFLNRFLMELTMGYLRDRAQGDLLPPGLPMGGEWHNAKFFNRPATVLPVRDVNAIPGYSCAWICALADFYKHTGAMRYLRAQHQLLLSMLRYMRGGFNKRWVFVNKHNEWNFVDWVPLLNGGKSRDAATDTRQAQISTDLYICWAVKRAAFLLHELGDNTHAAQCRQWYNRLVLAARKYLVNPRTQTYTSLPQPNAMAIISGVADSQQRAAINQRIFGPNKPFWRKIGTPYSVNFALFALSDLGHTARALAFVRRYWGGMLHDGATTFWEAYRLTVPRRRASRVLGYRTSLCHGWSAGITNWLTEYILGVEPVSGGFRRVAIAPHLGDLKWVSGKIPTPHGSINLLIQRRKNKRMIRLTVPPDVQAQITLRGKAVWVNGQAIRPERIVHGRCVFQISRPGVFTILTQ